MRPSLVVAPIIFILFVLTTLTPAQEITYAPELTKLDFQAPGRVVLLKNGFFACVSKGVYKVSADEGKTWQDRATLYEGGPPGIVGAGLLTETADGSLVLIYRDESSLVLNRYKEGDRHRVKPGAHYHIWSIRSTDGGKTWIDRQRIFGGFCGAIIDILTTREGRIIVPVTNLLYEPERQGTSVFSSGDGGKTWHEAKVIDIGGFGVEDGAMEGTVTQRKDGSILMYLRTTRDLIWESLSIDGGKTWSPAKPTKINSSNSPAYLLALKSGRHALVWNQVYPEGHSTVRRRIGYAEKPESIFREELSFALSDDGGQTWTKPTIIARQPGGKIAYSYMIERRPGEIWLSIKGQWLRIQESDFVAR